VITIKLDKLRDIRLDKRKKLILGCGITLLVVFLILITSSLLLLGPLALVSFFFDIFIGPFPVVYLLGLILVIQVLQKEKKRKKRFQLSRKKKIIIGVSSAIIIIIIISITLTVLILGGTFGISTLMEFALSPITFVLIYEIIAVIFMTASLFASGQKRFYSLITSIIITSFLVQFYLYIPYVPFHMSPNHPDSDWNHGSVIHILPAVNHERILLKTSFDKPLSSPNLNISSTLYPGEKMDTWGYYWCFDAQGLSANTTYQLRLEDNLGQLLCDPWPLTTFPALNSSPSNLRILAFTGSGGHDACHSWYGSGQIPVATRQKILNRALRENPDVIVGTGDQIYYDIRHGVSSKLMGDSRRAIQYSGKFDPSLPVLGTANENVLKNAVGPQVAYLYGTAARSIPSYFIFDDHDYFANDDAYEEDEINMQLLMAWINPVVKACVTFPPDDFMLELGRAAQRLFMPEFLPDPNRPLDLPGTGALDRPENVSECFGTLRYGDLVEGLMYDVRRYITLTGENGTFIPLDTEQWIIDRCQAENASYVINFSPISFGWSAGKWLSWYPDVKVKRDGQTVLSNEVPKYMWQEGWFDQHNRILNASFNMKNSKPFFVCGDMHTQTAGNITKSGDLDFSSNPITSILTGSMGVNGGGFPSGGLRGIEAAPPCDLTVIENLPSYEKAGFVILDITPANITIQFFGWRYGQEPVELIDTLTPHYEFVLYR
jgi:hypothetical protein